MRKFRSKEILLREIDDLKEEFDLKSDPDQEFSKTVDLKDKGSLPRDDLEDSKNSEEGKQSNLGNDNLRHDALAEMINQRPGQRKKRSSKSEASKIARYNISLLENIYRAYEPEQADHVVKIFRKGGLFNIEPIMEEDHEESFDTTNQRFESVGNNETESNPNNVIVMSQQNDNDRNNKYRDSAINDPLCDIEEENSVTLDGFEDFKKKHEISDITDEKGGDFNSAVKNLKDNKFSAGSSSYEEETPLSKSLLGTGAVGGMGVLAGIELTNRKKHKRIKKKKKTNGKYNAKIRELEEIYDSKSDLNQSVAVSSSFNHFYL